MILALAEISPTNLIMLIVSTLFGGGFLTAVIKLIKLRPEIGQTLVTSAEGVVAMQAKFIKQQAEEIQRQAEAIVLLRTQLDALDLRLRERIKEAEALYDRIEKMLADAPK